MADVVLPRETALGLVRHLKVALVETPLEHSAYRHVLRTLLALEQALDDPDARVLLADE